MSIFSLFSPTSAHIFHRVAPSWSLPLQLRPGGEEGFNKRRHLASTICKGLNYGRNLQESVSCLEPLIRKWVKEAVDSALNPYVSSPSSSSSSYNLVEPSVPSRSLQLQFSSNFPDTLFTGNRLISEDRNPVQVFMYNSVAKHIITCGPLSSLKVTVAVLDGDFDQEDWTAKEFDRKLVKNREGKRPLIAGELIVTLKNGVGYIGDVSFTDNSSWIRSGKFRLAAKANSTGNGDESIREAVSNAFRVKDHRGESYKKHFPPSFGDEVWRLRKIAKDGRSHKKLNESRIYSVGDFLRFYATDHIRLRDILAVSDKTWEIIIRHAKTCSSDGNHQQPVNSLTNYQMSMVNDIRQNTYRNPTEWTSTSDPSIAAYPMLSENSAADSFTNPNFGLNVDLQDYQREMGMNGVRPTVSSLSEVEQDNCSFQLGESTHSTLEGFNPSFRNSFQFADSPGGAGFCNFMGPQLSTDNISLMDDDNYGFMFLDRGINHDEIGRMISSANSGMISPRPKARWCKVLAVVKWRILARRNVAARKWKSYM